MRTQAERDVRGAMLLEKIAELEKIDVTDEEVEGEIGSMADYYRASPDEIRANLEKQKGLASIKNNLKTRKAIEALVSNAKIIDGEWVDENVGQIAKVEEKPKKASKAKSTAQADKPKVAKRKTAK